MNDIQFCANNVAEILKFAQLKNFLKLYHLNHTQIIASNEL